MCCFFCTVLEELGAIYLETVLLSVPRHQRGVEDLSKIWPVLDKRVEEQTILSVGMCDLDVNQLDDLCSAPQVRSIKS